MSLVERGGAAPGVRGEARAAGRGAQPLGGHGEAGPSVHTRRDYSDPCTGANDVRAEKRSHLGNAALFQMQWLSFRDNQQQVAAALETESLAYETACKEKAGTFIPLDAPSLRRTGKAVAEAATTAAALEKGRRARPLLAVAKAADRASRFGNGVQTAEIAAGLAVRVQKVAKALQKAASTMKADPAAALDVAAKASSWAETMRVVAEANAKAEDALILRRHAARRAFTMRLCASKMEIDQCGACGEYAEGTGKLVTMGCHARACPLCARHRSMEQFHELLDAMEAVPDVEGYTWRSMEMTLRRNPCDPGLHTVDALLARAEALKTIVKHVWDTFLGREKGAAVYSKLEIAGTGNVHVHLLHYGPYVPKAQLESVIRQVKKLPPGVSHGFTYIQEAKGDLSSLAAEVAKYVTKSNSPMSEDWLAGETREVMHPTLAARWEIATMGNTKLSQMYGALRGATKTEDKEDATPKEETDEGENLQYCVHCGVIDSMQRVVVDAETTIRAMHAAGKRALKGSRWKPKPNWVSPGLLDAQREHGDDVVMMILRDPDRPWREHESHITSRVEAIRMLQENAPYVRPDTIAPLSRLPMEGKTWVVSIASRASAGSKERPRVHVSQVVLEQAA